MCFRLLLSVWFGLFGTLKCLERTKGQLDLVFLLGKLLDCLFIFPSEVSLVVAVLVVAVGIAAVVV